MKYYFLLFLFILVSCSSFQPELELGVYYKRDMNASITGLGDFKGVTTAPYANEYQVVLEPKGSVEYIIIRSCAREDSYEHDQKKFLNIFPIGENKFSYTYRPNFIERNRVCPLRIDSFDRSNRQHSWLFLDFEHPDYGLNYHVWCNGHRQGANGISACQVRSGLVQVLDFSEPVIFAPPQEHCSAPVKMDDNTNSYEIEVALRECLYTFKNQAEQYGRITFIGYEGIKIEGE